ncbi:MAG: hypothetical protein P1V20_08145 [Verrucomicrobiales bacterium]|nr:hypothetical protein [Verrucomicrobiales bacterium]
MDHDRKKSGFPHLLSKSKSEEVEATPSSLASDFVSAPKPESTPASSGLSSSSSDFNHSMDEDDGMTNNISADLSERDKRQIYEAIDLIRRKLSFAKDFTDEERSNLMRLGKTGRTFVEKAQNLVESSPGILPRSFDVEEFSRDADLYQELGNIADELQRLSERVADTEAAVGSDAFTAALVVYQSGKMARCGDDMDNHLGGWRRKISESVFD